MTSVEKIKKENVFLYNESENRKTKLFRDLKGFDIYENDYVEVFFEKSPFPSYGKILNENRYLKIKCYCNVFDTYVFREVEE
jgi:hypothetical protein